MFATRQNKPVFFQVILVLWLSLVAFKVLFSCAMTLAFACFVFAPTPADHAPPEVLRSLRSPVAEELIANAKSSPLVRGERTITLPADDLWLSDSGEVMVFSDGLEFCVWFWDSRGLLGDYTASIYVPDESAAAPPGVYEPVERESANWWSSCGD